MKADDLLQAAEAFVKELVVRSQTPVDEHVHDTARRLAQMYSEILTPREFNFTTFQNKEEYDQIVLVDDIPFYSLCAHHALPFFGTATVAYLPRFRIVGLSKLPRTVEYFARRLQVQERMTHQIGDFLETHLEPVGTAVIVQGRHLCMEMRGVESPGAITTTSYMKGAFRENPAARQELLQLTGRKRGL